MDRRNHAAGPAPLIGREQVRNRDVAARRDHAAETAATRRRAGGTKPLSGPSSITGTPDQPLLLNRRPRPRYAV